jgi:hypothetical protein
LAWWIMNPAANVPPWEKPRTPSNGPSKATVSLSQSSSIPCHPSAWNLGSVLS